MKLILLLLLVSSLGGCVTPSFPKDAYLKNATSEVSTPWGTAKASIAEGATGAAAKNITIVSNPKVTP